MEKRPRVVVYGSSLQMAVVAASLKAEQSLEVVCVDPHSPTARQSLGELSPAAIVFDLTDPATSVDVSLLREKPGILLIGIDLESDEILVLSGHSRRALSVSDLVHVIQLLQQRQRLPGGQHPVQPLAVDKLHHHEGRIALHPEFVDGDDIRVL